jgi:hypothetical protein
MKSRSVAVMILVDTTDSRLFPENVDVSTAKNTATLRRVVLDNLANVTRIVMVMEEATAQVMALAHDLAARESGLTINRPPADYVPPTRD